MSSDGEDPGEERNAATTNSEMATDGNAREEDAPAYTIPKDDGFHVLQNTRRRAVLRYLLARRNRDRFRMRTVAEAVAAWEHDTTVQQLRSDERQRVYIALYQTHLPKLDSHDVIDYHQSRGVIETLPLLEAFDPYLDDGLDGDDATLVAPKPDGTESESSGAVTDRLWNVFGR